MGVITINDNGLAILLVCVDDFRFRLIKLLITQFMIEKKRYRLRTSPEAFRSTFILGPKVASVGAGGSGTGSSQPDRGQLDGNVEVRTMSSQGICCPSSQRDSTHPPLWFLLKFCH